MERDVYSKIIAKIKDLSDKINALVPPSDSWTESTPITDKTATITIPNTAKEAIVKVQFRTDISFSIPLSANQLSVSARKNYYDCGSVLASTNGGYGCRISVQNFVIGLDALYLENGTEDFSMTVYYR